MIRPMRRPAIYLAIFALLRCAPASLADAPLIDKIADGHTAALWAGFVRLNPGVAEELRNIDVTVNHPIAELDSEAQLRFIMANGLHFSLGSIVDFVDADAQRISGRKPFQYDGRVLSRKTLKIDSLENKAKRVCRSWSMYKHGIYDKQKLVDLCGVEAVDNAVAVPVASVRM